MDPEIFIQSDFVGFLGIFYALESRGVVDFFAEPEEPIERLSITHL